MSRKVVSLFSGAMGLDLGLHRAGLETAVTQEMMPAARQTIESNGVPLVPGDLKKMVAADPKCNFLLDKAELKSGEAFLLAGGPPCQSFSIRGKRLGMDDARGELLFTYLDVLEAVQPRFAVMENVKGLRKAVVGEGKPVIDMFRDRLRYLGYSSVYDVLLAANYGVPQKRERLVLIASRDGEPIHLPIPTHDKAAANGLQPWVTVRDALAGIPSPTADDFIPFSEKQREVMSHIGEGECWLALYRLRDEAAARGDSVRAEFYDDLGKRSMGSVWNRDRSGSTAFWRRLRWDAPAPTLVTTPLQRGTFFAHPSENRVLSVQEYAAIQGFPVDWRIAGSLAMQYKQIGNAVPVGLGEVVGRTLMAVAEGTDNGDYQLPSGANQLNYLDGK